MSKAANIAIFIPHLACNNACIFCNQNKIASTEKAPTPDEVKALLERVTPNSNAEIAFFGGSFTGIERALMLAYLEVARGFLTQGKFKGIRVSTRPDYIDKEVLDILKLYGVTTIELGIQSMNHSVLEASKRGHNVGVAFGASQLIKEYGFHFVAQMMVGMFGDTRDGERETAKKIALLKPNSVRIYPTVVIKNTALEELYHKGEYIPLTLNEAIDICSELLLFFEMQHIKVIRLGLHSDKELVDGSAIVAGAYHPAFRELCENKIFLALMEEKMPQRAKNITITVAKGCLSKALGQKRANILYLKDKYKCEEIYIKEDEHLKGRELGMRSVE